MIQGNMTDMTSFLKVTLVWLSINQNCAANAEHGVVTEAYGPLGIGRLLDNPTIASVAQAHGKTPAQALIRWSIQLGNVVIPRSASPERIKENLDVFDFELTDDEMATLNGLDDGTRFRPNPDTYTGT
jgi:diketogulonate reductase-like aldo/keto reductase